MNKYKSITEEGSYHDKMVKFIQQDMQRRDEEALWHLLKCKEGRWFLMRMLDETRINAKTFTGNSNTFYNEGRRDVGIGILMNISRLGLEAVKLKQIAELEYIENQIKAQELCEETMNEEGELKHG